AHCAARLFGASGPPWRGVLHLAGTVEDGLLRDIDAARVARAFEAKVLGALRLHEHTRALPLDFFVLFSSAVVAFGSGGQAAYAMANAMLDALAAARVILGLPAQSIGWGTFAGGMLTQADQRVR